MSDDRGAARVAELEAKVAELEAILGCTHYRGDFTIPTPGVYAIELELGEQLCPDGVPRRGSVRVTKIGEIALD